MPHLPLPDRPAVRASLSLLASLAIPRALLAQIPSATPGKAAVNNAKVRPIYGFAYGNAATKVFRSSEGNGGERWRDLESLSTDAIVTLTPHSVATIKYEGKR